MILYDPQCHELADHFLGDDDVSPAENELRIQSLAGAIQRAVEAWIDGEGEPLPPRHVRLAALLERVQKAGDLKSIARELVEELVRADATLDTERADARRQALAEARTAVASFREQPSTPTLGAIDRALEALV